MRSCVGCSLAVYPVPATRIAAQHFIALNNRLNIIYIVCNLWCGDLRDQSCESACQNLTDQFDGVFAPGSKRKVFGTQALIISRIRFGTGFEQ